MPAAFSKAETEIGLMGPVSFTPEQRAAELLLELEDGPGQRWLCDMPLFGRMGEI